MRLSKIYSNKPSAFHSITFVDGLNVIIAEIRVPENRDKDTHNLGKSTLGRLLDFCLLEGRDASFFLFKHFDLFKSFVFCLEVEIGDGSYLTIRRGVENASRINFKKHTHRHQNFSSLPDEDWDHYDIPFERAKDILDSLLDWRTIRPWDFRKGLGYLLRSQEDFKSVFQLDKYVRHADWKPFLAHLLGFESELLTKHYETEVKLQERQSTAMTVNAELGGSIQDSSKIEGILLLKQQEAEKKKRQLDAFDFRKEDKASTNNVVDNIDSRIAELNNERYSLNYSRRKIADSLEQDKIAFDPDGAKELFEEAGIFFDGQIKKDFEQLIAFNRSITEERRQYLEEERSELDARLKAINAELTSLGKRRSDALAYLSNTDIFTKYRKFSDELVTLRADITSLERQKVYLQRLQELRSEIRSLIDDRERLQARIEADVETKNASGQSLFSTIRVYFSEIVEEVIDRMALLSVSPNKLGHLDFSAEILDQSGNATSADLGHTYRKLICVAFDLAVLRAHVDEPFPRFVFHDGIFESLDDRKKENLLAVIRRYASFGLQPIITLIDSDLPARPSSDLPVFDQSEIVLQLHDQGEDGRLFKTKSW